MNSWLYLQLFFILIPIRRSAQHRSVYLGVFSLLSIGLQSQNFGHFSIKYENLDRYEIIDSAYLKCSYQLTYQLDSLQPARAMDQQIVLIGKTHSKCYSQIALNYNQFVKEYSKTHDQYPSSSDGAWTYEVFKNYPQGKETVTDIASMLHGNFVYEEELPVFNWQIRDEKQTILAYNCQKATMSFRGRDYIAWFATAIPIPNGPWKFGGLPGLILKVYDSKSNFIFECDGLEQLGNKEPIKFYKVNYTTVSRKELGKLYQRMHDDFAIYNKSLDIMTMEMNEKAGTSKIVEYSSQKVPYNPVELE